MDTLIAYAHDVPARVRRRLRLDCWAEIRPASWKHCWSYEVTQGEKGAWDLEVWAGRFYVVGHVRQRGGNWGVA